MSNEELIAEARAIAYLSPDEEEVAEMFDRLADALEATERKPVIDREALAKALFETYDHGTSPNAFREADHLMQVLGIEDKRAVQAEALEAAAAHGNQMHAEQGGIGEARIRADWLRARAAEIREGRA
jgi:hypothetical protein